MTSRLIFMSGSVREESMHRHIAQQAATIASELGADAQFIELADYPMPIYNGDDEAAHSLPDTAVALKQQFVEADGFFIASPEYNSSFSALLKNTIDWVSRKHKPDEAPLAAYNGKVAGLAAASGGGFGGLRGLVPLRMLLGNIGVLVVPEQTIIANASKKRDDSGRFTDETALKGLRNTVNAMIRATG